MPDDILPDPDPPALPAPPVDRRPRSITCDCCGCTLGGDGGVLRTGERAKKLAKIEDKFDSLTAEIGDLKSRLQSSADRVTALENELKAAQGKGKPAGDDDRY